MTHPLRQLEQLEEDISQRNGYVGASRWMIPYADLLTLLLGFFIVLYSLFAQENSQLAVAADSAQTALAQEQEMRVVANRELANLQTMLDTMASERDKIVMEMAAVQSDSEPIEDVEEKLLEELGLGDQQVTLTQDARGLVISFQDRIFFDPGKAELTSEAKSTLDKLGSVLSRLNRPIRVEGHTDNTPIKTSEFPSNWELSTARATVMLKYILNQHHLSPELLSAAGYGEFHPLADNSTKEGKRKNRRVDIVIVNTFPHQEATNQKAHDTIQEQ